MEEYFLVDDKMFVSIFRFLGVDGDGGSCRLAGSTLRIVFNRDMDTTR